MQAVTISAPAKLNFTLAITGMAENGYHSLDMMMQTISLYETVTLQKSKALTLHLPCSKVPANNRNTAYKAACAFFEEVGLCAGVSITIHKRIPVRAGMAGGSADAAAVLVGLNELYGAKLSIEELCKIGAKIGADVPFSIVGGTARVMGVGDILTKLPPCPACWITVVMPATGVSTPQAFARYDEIGSPSQPDTAAAEAAVLAGDLHALCNAMGNALAFSSTSRHNEPICKMLKENGALTALMTGSGAAVFGVFESKAKAYNAKMALAQKYPQCWVTQPVLQGARICPPKKNKKME